MKPSLCCLLACLSLALAACHSRPVERPSIEVSRSEPARPPAGEAVYVGDEYAQEQRALAARPHETAAPTF